MQGSFPIAPRPYQHVATEAGITEDEVIARVKRLLDERIIRQVTPIFDTRALGYSSMLVAAKVDPENPWRAANIINEHPGVSHNYLRNHEFNIWFTIATEPDSPLGLEGTLDTLAELAGAESIRQLPTLKLFKIRMDLEMEGGTDALAKAAEAVEPAETEPQPYDDIDIAVIRALQGDMPVIPEPYAPAAEQIGHVPGALARPPPRDAGAPAAAPRRGDPVPPPRRLQRQRDGRLEGPRRADPGDRPRMAAFRGICHCYQRPTYADWPYSVFTMAHGRSKEECDAILDSIAEETGINERATLYSSTEFKKIRLLYFTDDYRAWEREHAERVSPLRRELYAQAQRAACPAASTRRSGRCARSGAIRSSSPRGAGRDDHRRRRQRLHRLGQLVGPADPRPRRPVGRRGGDARPRIAGRPSAPRPKTRWLSRRDRVSRFRRSRCCG